LEVNGESHINVFFGKVEGFESEPVIPTLVRLSNAAKQVSGQFNAFLTTRH
jgi:hypothetical protein